MEGTSEGLRIGLATAQYGPFADPDAVATVAGAAEEMGFDSLWVGDRLLYPLAPQEGYAGGAWPWPAAMRRFLDPLCVLAIAAARTRRVRLGTSVLVAPLYPAPALARSLTTLDVLSGGRLDVGLGSGWSRDEFAAAGVPWRRRGARLEETLDVLEAMWGGGPIDHAGPAFRVVPIANDLAPVQRPRPPIYLGGWKEPALERIARRADGWLAAGMPPSLLTRTWSWLRDAAARHGRDPDRLRIVYRANPHVTAAPPGPERPPFTGTIDQVVDDLLGVAATGVHEILVDLNQTARDVDELLQLAGRALDALRMAARP